MRKHSSLLLEVLVAFVLAATALTLVCPSPHNFLKRELKTVKEIESERIATLTLAEVRNHLPKWQEMPPASAKTHTPLPDHTVTLSDTSFTVKRRAEVGYLKEFSDDKKRLISCTIKVDKRTYHFFFPQNKPKKEEIAP